MVSEWRNKEEGDRGSHLRSEHSILPCPISGAMGRCEICDASNTMQIIGNKRKLGLKKDIFGEP